MEWVRAAALAGMVAGMIGGKDPTELIPERYRPAKPAPRAMTPEERAIALEVGVINLGRLLKGG